MASTCGLFRSNGGLTLVPEICLRVAELLLDSEPTAIRSLLLSSKVSKTRMEIPCYCHINSHHCRGMKVTSCCENIDNGRRSTANDSQTIYSLLKTHEKSITKTVSQADRSISLVNSRQTKVLSSRMPSGLSTVTAFSYAWFSEMRCRKDTVDRLISHEVTEMLEEDHSWPTLNVSKADLSSRMQQFKRRAMCLIYRLADCGAGIAGVDAVRKHQAIFLEKLSASDLAALGCSK